MNIIAEAKEAPTRIKNVEDLLETQLQTLKTLFEHKAICENEFRKSTVTIVSRMRKEARV